MKLQPLTPSEVFENEEWVQQFHWIFDDQIHYLRLKLGNGYEVDKYEIYSPESTQGKQFLERRARTKLLKLTNNNKSRGLGDTIKKVIDKVTFGKVKQCGGCKKRREAMNKILPYGDKDNARH